MMRRVRDLSGTDLALAGAGLLAILTLVVIGGAWRNLRRAAPDAWVVMLAARVDGSVTLPRADVSRPPEERSADEASGTTASADAIARSPLPDESLEPIEVAPPTVPLPVAPVGNVAILRDKDLTIPVLGIVPQSLRDTFGDPRSGGRTHLALDIMAPRDRPVLAVEDGHIARLYQSRLGGITVYQLDPTERFVYYYAHLERYAPGLDEGDAVERGQIIGYVGSSGNAPDHAPHLHFAIHRLEEGERWWQGDPINPYNVFGAEPDAADTTDRAATAGN